MAHDDTHGSSHARALPADLSAPAFVDGWRSRAIIVAAVAAVVAVILAFFGQAQDQLGWDHLFRAYMLGLTFTF
jgi:anti-sigma-K factor RskA